MKIYNSLSRQEASFQPLEAGHVRMYVCGMTVYDFCHLGHARVLVVFDMVQRWLKTLGYQVTYVRNITDIDDKIIRRALERGESLRDLTNRMIAAMHEDEAQLLVQAPTHEPRATEYVPQMLDLIERLAAKGLAYQSRSGDVLYSVRKFADYGKLSGKTVDELRAGERVAVEDDKNDPLDFVLWKHAKTDEPAEAKWDGAYGLGRPGWHIECSAMSQALLGESFDIHGGGADLQFPHHENEIAQSEGACGKPLAQVWMHGGFLNIDNTKMSKSLGNFFTIREVLERYDGETIRFFILRSHYRSPLNYSDWHLDDARAGLKRLYTCLQQVPAQADFVLDWSSPYAARFKAAMDADFATPEALAVLFELTAEVNRTASSVLAAELKALGAVLGLLQAQPEAFLQAGNDATGSGLDAEAIEAQIALRQAAKSAKDFAQADTIRKNLLEQGVVLKDTAAGTVWERV